MTAMSNKSKNALLQILELEISS